MATTSAIGNVASGSGPSSHVEPSSSQVSQLSPSGVRSTRSSAVRPSIRSSASRSITVSPEAWSHRPLHPPLLLRPSLRLEPRYLPLDLRRVLLVERVPHLDPVQIYHALRLENVAPLGVTLGHIVPNNLPPVANRPWEV